LIFPLPRYATPTTGPVMNMFSVRELREILVLLVAPSLSLLVSCSPEKLSHIKNEETSSQKVASPMVKKEFGTVLRGFFRDPNLSYIKAEQ